MTNDEYKPAQEAEGEQATAPKKAADEKASLDERAFLEDALKKYQRGYARDEENIDAAYEDAKFRAGDHWPEEIKRERDEQHRPCLTINRVPQFVRQVTGDMRQMRPAIKVVPVDRRGDPKTAELLAGMCRYIENRSQARRVYTAAADSQVATGIGHWQITTEYASESTFNQELRILGIEDGVSVVWDPDAALPTREDAMYCFVPVDVSRDAFEERWPDAKAEDFGRGENKYHEGWYSEDYVRVAQYWLKKPITRKLALMRDGTVEDLTGADEQAIAEAAAAGARIEDRPGFKVCRYLISCTAILEGPLEWPGRYIPVVPLIGEEVHIGRKTVRHGVVRFLKDPQRMHNYTRSAQTETVALQPKAPFVGTWTMFKNHVAYWETANTKNHPFLPYDIDEKHPGAKPDRTQPPVASSGLAELLADGREDMHAVVGIYPAALGAASNETSGRAILARQREGDTGTFVYVDNLALAIEYTGRILVDLIPHVYDTERTIRVVGEDNKVDLVEINKPVVVNGQPTVLHDVTVGAYDVTIDTGPSYTAKREEAKEGMKEFIQAAPQAAPLIGDLYAEAQDWPLADKIGKRLHALLPPQVIAAEESEAEGGQPAQPQVGPEGQPVQAPPSPEQQAQAMQVAQQQRQMAVEEHAQQIAMQVAEAEATAKMAKARADIAQAQAAEKIAALKLQTAELDFAVKLQQAQQPQTQDSAPQGA